ncbi:MAG: hypothetical protein WCJ97_03420 [Phycisphaerae bacterium]
MKAAYEPNQPYQLTPAAADAVDDALAGVIRPDGPDQAQAQAAVALVKLIQQTPAPQPPEGTLDRLLATLATAPIPITTQPTTPPSVPSLWRKHWVEYLALGTAACVTIVLLIPGLRTARATAQRSACAANLASIGQGFADYAANNTGQLPALPTKADTSWRGTEGQYVLAGESNSANLAPMLQTRPELLAKLICPSRSISDGQVVEVNGHKDLLDAGRGYSYINMRGVQKPVWNNRADAIIMADRNPLFENLTTVSGSSDNSLNHARWGQNVLSSDGQVRWVKTPNIGPNDDNIWTIRGHNQATYAGYETVTSPTDIFVSP